MEDKFRSSKTFTTTGQPKKKFVDYGDQYIKALVEMNVKFQNPDDVKDVAASFRSDFAISGNKRLNKDLKNKWVEYYKSNH